MKVNQVPGVADAEKVVGQHLRELRKARGWPLREVAGQMKMFGYTWHQTVVAKIETGQRPLRVNEAVAMARLFGVSLEQLLVSPADAVPDGALAGRITAAEKLLAQAEGRQQAAQAALRDADTKRARLKAEEQDAGGQVVMLRATLDALRQAAGETGH